MEEMPMPSLTIRDIDESTANRLREQAKRNGSTPEDEARTLLKDAQKTLVTARGALSENSVEPKTETLFDLHKAMLAIAGGGVDLTPYLPSRMPGKERPFIGEE